MFQRTMSLYVLLLLFVHTTYSRSITSQVVSNSEQKDDACSFSSGEYKLSWSYDELSSDVVFRLSTQSSLDNFWSGVYMGEETPTDAIGVFVRAGQIGLVDAQVTEDGIESDNLTNVQSLNFDLQEGGHLTAEFARPLSTQDPTDVDLQGCTTFFFPVVSPQIDMGGPIDLPQDMPSKRVCNIQEQCLAAQEPSDLVKRDDKPVCAYSNQKSSVSWRVNGDNLIFSVQHPAKKGKWWTAIGVGDSMQDLGLVMAFTENGKLKKTGGYKTVGYAPPSEESSAAPGLTELNSAVRNNKALYELSVGMDFLKKYTENGCTTLQIAILAGQYGKDFAVKKHEETPLAIPICGIDQCTSEGATDAEVPVPEAKGNNKKNNKNNKHPNKNEEAPVEQPIQEPTPEAVQEPVIVPEPAIVPEQPPLDQNTNQMNTEAPVPETGKGKGHNKKNNKNNKHPNKATEGPVDQSIQEPTMAPEPVVDPAQQPQEQPTNQHNTDSNIELVAETGEQPAVEGEGAQVRDEPLEVSANETEGSGQDLGLFGPAAKAVQEMNLTSTTVAGNVPVTTSGNWPIGGAASQSATPVALTQPSTASTSSTPVAVPKPAGDRPVSLPAGAVGASSIPTLVPEAVNQSTTAPVGFAMQSTSVPLVAVTHPSSAQQGAAMQSSSVPSVAVTHPSSAQQGAAMQPSSVPSVVVTHPSSAQQGAAIQPSSSQPIAAQSTVSPVLANRPTSVQPLADAADERTQPTPAAVAEQPQVTANVTEGAAAQEKPDVATVDALNGSQTLDNATFTENVNNVTHPITSTTVAPATTTTGRAPLTPAGSTTTAVHTTPLTTTTTTTKAMQPTVTVTQTQATHSTTVVPLTTKQAAPATAHTTVSTKAPSPAPETSRAPPTSVTPITGASASSSSRITPTQATDTPRPATLNVTEAIKGNELRKDVPVDAPLEKNGLGSAEDLLERPDLSSNETTVTLVTVPSSVTVIASTSTTVSKPEITTGTTVQLKTVDRRTGSETVDAQSSNKTEDTKALPTTSQPTAVTSAAGVSAGAQPASEVARVPETCDQEDLMVCEGYFNDYLSKVKEWSDHNNHTVDTQMWKACKLLSEVRHVPTLCCKRFKQDCSKEMEKIPKKN